MYGASRGCWVAMGDPVGPLAERTELVWRFRELCDHYDVYPVFYEVTPASLPLYLDVGLTPFKFGECARVALASWSLEGPRRKGTRYVLKRQERDGSTFEVLPPDARPGGGRRAARGVRLLAHQAQHAREGLLAGRLHRRVRVQLSGRRGAARRTHRRVHQPLVRRRPRGDRART